LTTRPTELQSQVVCGSGFFRQLDQSATLWKRKYQANRATAQDWALTSRCCLVEKSSTMKCIAVGLAVVPCIVTWSLAQPIKLTGLSPGGYLTWTNLVCTTQPVYELLKARTLGTPWNHEALVTNQTSLLISNELGAMTGGVFLRIAWVEEPPLVLNYEFTESAVGMVTVTGRLEVVFAGPSPGTRSFGPTENYVLGYGLHPVGQAALPVGRPAYSHDGISLRVFLVGSGSEGSIYLDGTLERSELGGHCSYTRYSGNVWFVGIQTEGIGTFIATRAP
jgi:hypothetical protein